MNERFIVVRKFDEQDNIIGWHVIDGLDDNRIVSRHETESDAREQAARLELTSQPIDKL